MENRIILLSAVIICILSMEGCKAMKDYIRVDDASGLGNYVGKKIILHGKISNIMWQHIIQSRPGMIVQYLDFDNTQIVIYTKEEIKTDKTVAIGGTVISAEGGIKGSKMEEGFTECQIVVDWYKIIPTLPK